MDKIWSCICDEAADFQNTFWYEGDILADSKNIFYVCDDRKRGGDNSVLFVYVIDKESGRKKRLEIKVTSDIRAGKCYFIRYNGKVYLAAGDIFFYKNDSFTRVADLGVMMTECSHIVDSGRLYSVRFSPDKYERVTVGKNVCYRKLYGEKHCYMLYCFDLEKTELKWSRNISTEKDYTAGELCVFENKLVCYADNKLLFIDMKTGEIENEIYISRADKLYRPMRLGDNSLLMGYTNWTVAGVLKYNTDTKKVIWKNNRKFEGPELRCYTALWNNIALWSKNDTELIAADTNDGSTLYRLRTEPWLYTEPVIIGDSIIYGTSGADGYINCADIKSGEKRWSVFLKNGCEFYGIHGGSIIAGDYDGIVRKINVSDGKVTDSITLGSAVVGRIAVDSDYAYTVVTYTDGDEYKCSLVKLKI